MAPSHAVSLLTRTTSARRSRIARPSAAISVLPCSVSADSRKDDASASCTTDPRLEEAPSKLEAIRAALLES